MCTPYSKHGKTLLFTIPTPLMKSKINNKYFLILRKMKESHWTTLNRWFLMNLYLFLIELDFTIVYSILKLWENTSFYNSNITHEVINKYQRNFIFKENHRKSLNNTEQMVFYELIFVFNRIRLHHCVVHTQFMGRHFFYNSNITHDIINKFQSNFIFK